MAGIMLVMDKLLFILFDALPEMLGGVGTALIILGVPKVFRWLSRFRLPSLTPEIRHSLSFFVSVHPSSVRGT